MKNFILKLVRKLTHSLEGTGIGKIRPLFVIYSWFISFLKPKIVITEGSKMLLDNKDSLLLSIYPNFEPGVTKVVKSYVKKGMSVVDAGAHIGYFTLLMARLVGPKGKVYAFEPDKNNFNLLKKNVELNSLTNVVLENKALSEKSRKIKLYLSKDNSQDNRIFADKKEKRSSRVISGVSLDSYFKNDPNIDFIKMDIQGAELAVMKGSKKLLSKNKKLTIVLEFWPYALRMTGNSPLELIRILKKYGSVKVVNEASGKLTNFSDKKIKSGEDLSLELLFKKP